MTGFELWKTPEYEALCKLLGIDRSLPTERIGIELDINAAVRVMHTFLPNPSATRTVTQDVANLPTAEELHAPEATVLNLWTCDRCKMSVGVNNEPPLRCPNCGVKKKGEEA